MTSDKNGYDIDNELAGGWRRFYFDSLPILTVARNDKTESENKTTRNAEQMKALL